MKKEKITPSNDTSGLAERLIDKGEPIELVFHYCTNENLLRLFSLASKILSRMDKVFFLESLITILRELLNNAQKANAKRLFFQKQNMTMSNDDDYEKGMDGFREYLKEKIDTLRETLQGGEYFIRVELQKVKRGVVIVISNNVTLRDDEREKIQYRVQTARNLVNFMEVYNNIYDTSEGAGLGIILSIMLMKHAGIDPENYNVRTGEGITSVSLLIPDTFRPMDLTTEVKRKILSMVECLPSFPESVNELLAMCNDPAVEIGAITDKLLRDPSISADVLKMANSAGFITGRKIETIHDALMIIGIDNLESVLIVAGARRILSQRYKKFEDIWDHCNKTAFYAGAIARRLKYNDLSEKVILAGLLHDLGKIVLLSTDMELVKQISECTADRKIRTTTLIEEAAIGLSHASLGGMIARQWNFPEYLVDAISYHHAPLCAGRESSDLVFTVYLANLLIGVEEGRYDYCYAETQVLERFKFTSREQLKELHDHITDAFSRHPER